MYIQCISFLICKINDSTVYTFLSPEFHFNDLSQRRSASIHKECHPFLLLELHSILLCGCFIVSLTNILLMFSAFC